MARVINNPLLSGVSGRIGNLIVRQVNGQTILQMAEAPGERAPRSPKQQAHLDRMHRAKQYAKAQILDPEAKALYSTGIDTKRTSAYTVAVSDYMNAPEITAVDASGYRGKQGKPIRVQATDDFGVVAVWVQVLAPEENLLEEGPAAQQGDGSWLFMARQATAALPGTIIVVEAYDRPGNVTTKRQVLQARLRGAGEAPKQGF